jgi:hypothetical protein
MDAVEWASIPGPKYYDPEKAEDAFAYLVKPGSDTRGAASSIRSAVGNDHAGTLYPAAVTAVRRLFEVILAALGGPGRRRSKFSWIGGVPSRPNLATRGSRTRMG